MAVTDYDFILTRNELIEESYRKVGVLSEYESASSEQIASGNTKLNLILKEWSEEGTKLWTQVVEEISTVASQNYVSVPTDNGLSFVDLVMLKDGTTEYELEKISKREYEQRSDKDSESMPIAFYQDFTDSRLYFYQVPDAIYSLRLYGVKTLKDWEVESDTGELSARWQSAIKYALAAELAEDYRLDLATVRDYRIVAMEKYRKASSKEFTRSTIRRVRGYSE